MTESRIPTKDELLNMATAIASSHPDICPICFSPAGSPCSTLLHRMWLMIMEDESHDHA